MSSSSMMIINSKKMLESVQDWRISAKKFTDLLKDCIIDEDFIQDLCERMIFCFVKTATSTSEDDEMRKCLWGFCRKILQSLKDENRMLSVLRSENQQISSDELRRKILDLLSHLAFKRLFSISTLNLDEISSAIQMIADCHVIGALKESVFLVEKSEEFGFLLRCVESVYLECKSATSYCERFKITTIFKNILSISCLLPKTDCLFGKFFVLSQEIPELPTILGMLLVQVSENVNEFVSRVLSNSTIENGLIDVSQLDLHHKACLVRGIVISIEDLDDSRESLLEFLLNSCQIEQDPCTKILCLETLALFIRKHHQIPSNRFQDILLIVTKHWEDSVDAINGKVRMILANLIPLMQKSNFPLQNCIKSILSMEKTSRAKYGILSGLFSLTQSELISGQFLNFISSIENPVLSHRIGELCVEIAVATATALNCQNNWIEHLLIYLQSQPSNVPLKHLSAYFFNPLARRSKESFFLLLEAFSNKSSMIYPLVIMLKLGMTLGYIEEFHSFIEALQFKSFLVSENVHLRLEAFGLLCNFGPKVSLKAPSQEVLNSYLYFLRYNFQLTDSENRQQVLTYSKQFFLWISFYTLKESADFGEFYKNLFIYLQQCLNTLNCNQRIEIALSHLKIFMDVFRETCAKKAAASESEMNEKYSKSLEIFDSLLQRISQLMQYEILALLSNSFSDNRLLAFRILSILGRKISIPLSQVENQVSIWIGSLKTCEAEGGANLQAILNDFQSEDYALQKANEFLKSIQETINFALGNSEQFLLICGERPLAGKIISIKNYLQKAPKNVEFSSRCLQILGPLSELVYPVLFHQSPEGCIPDELSEGTEENSLDSSSSSSSSTKSQILACFCWRSLKEYSELVSLIFSKLQPEELPSDVLEFCMNKYREMLMFIRHRGVFLSIYNALYAICLSLLRSKNYSHIPKKWLEELVDSISDVNAILGVTRRSGGLPFLFQALLLSQYEINRGKAVFSSLISRLSQFLSCSTSSNETKVHCLNILRALFKDAKIGTEIVQFAEEILSNCISGFTSEDWAVRNGCLMLFSALITRIFGCKGANDSSLTLNQITFAEFYSRYNSKLIPLMLQELELSCQNIKKTTSLHPSLFPILSLLSRLSSGNPTPIAVCKQFSQLVVSCFDSPVFKIREIAAKCLCSLSEEDKKPVIASLFSPSPNIQHSNYLHACLCFLKDAQIEDFDFKTIKSQLQCPLNVYFMLQLNKSLSISDFNPNWNDPIGQDYLKLQMPLTKHENCHIYHKHSNHSLLETNVILQIALGNCSSFCKKKSFQLLTQRILDSRQIQKLEEYAKCFVSQFSPFSVASWIDSAIECFFEHFSWNALLKEMLLHFSNPDFPNDIRLCIAKCSNKLVELDEISVLALVLLIQDDDFEVRFQACQTASRLLGFTSGKCESFCLEALLVWAKQNEKLGLLHQHYQNELQKQEQMLLLRSEQVLFEHEESNLYREFPLELSILKSLSHSTCTNQQQQQHQSSNLLNATFKNQQTMLIQNLQQLVEFSL